jgi:uncharacterized membrane protein YccC
MAVAAGVALALVFAWIAWAAWLRLRDDAAHERERQQMKRHVKGEYGRRS